MTTIREAFARAGIILGIALTSACTGDASTARPTSNGAESSASPTRKGLLDELAGTYEQPCGTLQTIVIGPAGTAVLTWSLPRHDADNTIDDLEVRFAFSKPNDYDLLRGAVTASNYPGMPAGARVRVAWNVDEPGIVLTTSDGDDWRFRDPGYMEAC
ncbi:hypothetical protein E0H26_13700 [Micromonospora zingiberis]|uniref:Uncharacterized protein n=1 Tax=Micromonospora zingiberis TaxID=2053011 RepID=A0A4R0GIH0_9ACTN|nr:hypothetical protein [Micromonospora zingiberis]TCB97304.1 hypothetical protein E0H26_13700 [Micromonospora zingiberis]